MRTLERLGVTVDISTLSVVLPLALGVFIGLGMCSCRRPLRWPMQIYLEFVHIMPQLVPLFVTYFGLMRVARISLDDITAFALVLILWGGVGMGDLVRGVLVAVLHHQYGSAYVLGFTPRQTMCRVILPQALRRLASSAVNLIARMIEMTSLVVLIGVVEIFKVGQRVIGTNRFNYLTTSLWIYGLIFAPCFLIHQPILFLSRHTEKTRQN